MDEKILTISPNECTRWPYADRSLFEFGDISALADDIRRNGQIEPIFVRPVTKTENNQFKYEVIAGSRRWKACFEAGLPLKAIVRNISDEEAAIIQIKENQALAICDYSKGLYYAKLLQNQKITQEELAKNINCSRQKLQRFLSFNKVPHTIWDAVNNISKVSSSTASTIYTLSQKGEQYVNILIDLAEEIKKGAGAHRLEGLVNKILENKDNNNLDETVITLPSGADIGTWKNNSLKFKKFLNIDKDKFLKHVIKFFDSPNKNIS